MYRWQASRKSALCWIEFKFEGKPNLQTKYDLAMYGGVRHGALFFSLVFVTGFLCHDCRKKVEQRHDCSTNQSHRISNNAIVHMSDITCQQEMILN